MLMLMALLAATTPAPQPEDTSVPKDAVVIVNSGSTNTASYRIVVAPSGRAQILIAEQEPAAKTLSSATTETLFRDVKAAMPLDTIKTEPCMKSASFGTTTRVRYGGKQSPDLSCSTGAAAARLSADVDKVTTELAVAPLRRPGGAPHAIVAPSPKPSE